MKKSLTLYTITAVMFGLLVIILTSTVTPQFSLQEQPEDRQLSTPEEYGKNEVIANSDAMLVASNNALRIVIVGLLSGIITVLLFQYFSKHI